MNVLQAAYLSGFLRGLCMPDLGVDRRLFTKCSVSFVWVSGYLMKGSPLYGSGMVADVFDSCHSPFTAWAQCCE